MILLMHFLFAPILLLLSLFLIQNATGEYVPRVYGHVDPSKCLFVTQTGEKHQIYRIHNFYMFGRVYLLDEQNAKMMENKKCQEIVKLENHHPEDIFDDRILFYKRTAGSRV
jgi:hypothetical protein